MILRRYILIFTLALISCAGTNYIHSISGNDVEDEKTGPLELKVVDNDIEEMEGVSSVMKRVQLIKKK